MSEVINNGLDIAKHVFHAHGADERVERYSARRSVEENCWISLQPNRVAL